MFEREYLFKGRHSEIISKLTSELDSINKFKLFERNIDAFILAPIVGFIYGRRSEVDTATQIESNRKINYEQLSKESETLNFNYKLIMLLHDKDKIDAEERLNRAFRYGNKHESKKMCDSIYESYVLGGLDVLKEKLLDNSTYIDDYINSMYKFIEEYNKRYEEVISDDYIIELCRKAGE